MPVSKGKCQNQKYLHSIMPDGAGETRPIIERFRMNIPKDDIIDNTRFFLHNTDGDYTIENEVHQDVYGIVKQNQQERDASDGFTSHRTMRKIMSLSSVDYLNALKKGYDLNNSDPRILKKEVYRYLNDIGRESGYQTVRHLISPNHSNIIVK